MLVMVTSMRVSIVVEHFGVKSSDLLQFFVSEVRYQNIIGVEARDIIKPRFLVQLLERGIVKTIEELTLLLIGSCCLEWNGPLN